ncbi:MAG: hypothetical protein A2252_02005 [Elusimicrobia bacterium RIFOXYA2_FULL_39_19]|nr:MAG: hypothetical protein A2252_02005 [Elusimicrobia bacterium RIFOXYA2_FULL_39_19]
MRKIILVLLFELLSTSVSAQNVLKLDEYLQKVGRDNPALKAINMSIDSSGNKILEMDMIYSPYLVGNYTWMDDKAGSGFGSSLNTSQMLINSWTFNLNKRFQTGSNVSFGYTNTDTDITLASPTTMFGPFPVSRFKAYDMKPYVKVEQSLLRDFMSRQTDANINKTKSLVRAGQYMQYFSGQQIILKAHLVYMNLSLSREILNFRKEELARSEEILKWSQNRVDLDLADEGDLLQVEALHKLRQLTLQMATEDEKNASRDYNELLGLSEDNVTDQTQPLSEIIAACENTDKITYTGQRADVLASKASYKSAEYAKTETLYRAYPEVSATGAMSLHGLDLSQADAFKQITGADKPTYSIGLNLIVPLDVPTLRKVVKGYDVEYDASKENLTKAQLSAKKDWTKLSENWKNVKQRLALAKEIKEIQSLRLANERKKFERGRTTMFQLLSAENDLDDSTINVYRLMFEMLSVDAQVDLYNTQEMK